MLGLKKKKHGVEALSSSGDGFVQVHRLVVVDQDRRVKGIVSLSDLLNYIILRPMGKPHLLLCAILPRK